MWAGPQVRLTQPSAVASLLQQLQYSCTIHNLPHRPSMLRSSCRCGQCAEGQETAWEDAAVREACKVWLSDGCCAMATHRCRRANRAWRTPWRLRRSLLPARAPHALLHWRTQQGRPRRGLKGRKGRSGNKHWIRLLSRCAYGRDAWVGRLSSTLRWLVHACTRYGDTCSMQSGGSERG